MNKLNKFVILLTILTCVLTQGIVTSSYSSKEESKIHFRKSAIQATPHNVFPFYARLVRSEENQPNVLCGGSLINRRWIVTAATCVKDGTQMDITFGASTQNPKNLFYYVAKAQIRHPKFKLESAIAKTYDIGLVLTSKTVVFDQYVFPVALPSFNLVTKDYRVLHLKFDNFAKNLQYQCLELLDHDDCKVRREMLDNFTVINYHICAVSAGQMSICDDKNLGGPLIADGILIGVASMYQCSNGFINIFTRIWPLYDWIADHIHAPFSVREPQISKGGECHAFRHLELRE